MKTLRILLLIPALSFIFSTSHASDVEMFVSSETAQFTINSDSSVIGWGGANLGFSLFYNQNNDIISQISLLQTRQASETAPLTFGVGLRAYAGRLDKSKDNIVALGIGGEVRYTFPGSMPQSAYLQIHYAPKVTSLSDAKRVSDVLLGYQIEVLPQTVAFVGIRRLDVDTKVTRSDNSIDDNRVHFGVRLAF